MTKILKKQIIILVVIITALLSCLGVALTSAKYYTGFTGSATMQVASFGITVTGELKDFAFTDENKSIDFEFEVQSASEVAISYDVVITLPTGKALPSGVTFSIGNKSAQPDSTGLIYTIANVGELAGKGEKNTHIFTASATEFGTEIALSGIKIDVVATQKSPN